MDEWMDQRDWYSYSNRKTEVEMWTHNARERRAGVLQIESYSLTEADGDRQTQAKGTTDRQTVS